MTFYQSLLRLLAGAVAAFALSCYAAATHAPLVLGSYAYPGLDRAAAIRPLAKLVGAATGEPVRVLLYDDPDQLAGAIKAGEVDIAITNLGAWLDVASHAGIEPLVVVLSPPEVRDRYRAVLLVRHSLPATSLEDVRERADQWRLAAVMPGSASGGLVQGYALAQTGRGPAQWRSVSYFGSHVGALAALANDKADLAAVAEAPWLSWQAAQKARSASGKLPRVLWRSAPLPSGTLACRKSHRLDCAALAAVLLHDTPETRNAAFHLGRGWPEWAGAQRFALYDHAAYLSLGLAGPVPQTAQLGHSRDIIVGSSGRPS